MFEVGRSVCPASSLLQPPAVRDSQQAGTLSVFRAVLLIEDFLD